MSVDSPQGMPGQPAKKGMGVWGWVAIGCGALLLLVLGTCFAGGMFLKHKVAGMADDFQKNPAKAAAEMAIKFNPDVEEVSSTDTEMTLRDKKTGETVTLNFEDIKNGNFSFKTKDGETKIDAGAAANGQGGTLTVTGANGQTATFGAGSGSGTAPSWLPIYPGAEVSGNYDATTAEGHAGAITVSTADSVDKVMAFYEEKLKDAGFRVEKITLGGTAGNGGTVTGTSEGDKRTVGVVLSSSDGKTQAMVTFNDKK
ncbi:MAG: hypothetical protein ABI609_12510 [Acidobacteriota bacterium]